MNTKNLHVIKITTPKARKEYICECCGQPINKGEVYASVLYRQEGKLVRTTTHQTCPVKKKTEELKKPRMTEYEYMQKLKEGMTAEEQKKADNDHVNNLLEMFSFNKVMFISFVPLVIKEMMWHYALDVCQKCADRRISSTVKLTRQVRQLRTEYENHVKQSLDQKHRDKFLEELKDFMEENANDLTIMWFSANASLMKSYYGNDLDIKTDAFCAIIVYKALVEHEKVCQKMLEEKTGVDETYHEEIMDRLVKLMEQYISPAKLDYTIHVNTCIKILNKRFASVEFNVV